MSSTWVYQPLLPAAANGSAVLKAWNGSAWAPGILKRWNGSAWILAPVQRWNGSAWVL